MKFILCQETAESHNILSREAYSLPTRSKSIVKAPKALPFFIVPNPMFFEIPP